MSLRMGFAIMQKGEPMNDLISRQDAIDELDKFIQWCDKALRSPLITSVDAYAVKVERASLKHYREVLELLEPAHPPISWLMEEIERLEKRDGFAKLDAAHLRVLIKRWEQEVNSNG